MVACVSRIKSVGSWECPVPWRDPRCVICFQPDVFGWLQVFAGLCFFDLPVVVEMNHVMIPSIVRLNLLNNVEHHDVIPWGQVLSSTPLKISWNKCFLMFSLYILYFECFTSAGCSSRLGKLGFRFCCPENGYEVFGTEGLQVIRR